MILNGFTENIGLIGNNSRKNKSRIFFDTRLLSPSLSPFSVIGAMPKTAVIAFLDKRSIFDCMHKRNKSDH
jgi:hypothetical protein